MQVYELSPRYDSRASFYGKARVEIDDQGIKRLISYTTHVASIFPDGRAIVFDLYSQTTLRHIKEFLKQEGLRADNSKQIMVDYGIDNQPLDESKLAAKFTPFYQSKQWIEVRTPWGELLRGYVGKSTGWRPVYLLMRRRNAIGSSEVLDDRYEITQTFNRYVVR